MHLWAWVYAQWALPTKVLHITTRKSPCGEGIFLFILLFLGSDAGLHKKLKKKKITIFLIILQYSFDNNPILFILSISLLVYYLACYYLYILCLRKLLVASHKVLCIIIQRQQGEIQGLRWGSVVSITLKWWTLIVLSLMLRSKNIENKLWCLAAESQIRITLLWTTNWSQPVELGLISNSIYTLKGKS